MSDKLTFSLGMAELLRVELVVVAKQLVSILVGVLV